MIDHFLPPTAQMLVFVGAFVLVAPLSFWLLSRVGFPSWPADPASEFFGWERDRVLAVAKGTATSATGFLTAVVIALLKEGIKADVPGIAVLGCLLGAVGLLMFASQMSISVRASTVVNVAKNLKAGAK